MDWTSKPCANTQRPEWSAEASAMWEKPSQKCYIPLLQDKAMLKLVFVQDTES